MPDNPTVEFVHTGATVHPKRVCSDKQATNHYRWAQIVNELSRNDERSQYIYNDIKNLITEGKQIIIISDRLYILDQLVAQMIVPPTVSFARITGDTSPSRRAELMLRFSKKMHQVLLCSNVADALPLHELEFDYLALVTPTSHTRFHKRYKYVMRQNPPPIIRDYVDDVPWIHATVKKRIASAFAKGWGVSVNVKPEGAEKMVDKHERTPTYCGRIGGEVTLRNGICPECGWHKEEEKPPTRKYVRTASRIPEKYVVVEGAGQSNFGPGNDPWETTAYDIALQEGGIENCNIVKYTSVIPPEARMISIKEARQEGLFHHGMVLECIMAQVDGNEGQHICAGVGTFDVFKGEEFFGGFAVEYEGVGSPHKAQTMLRKSMDGLFSRRYGGDMSSYEKAYKDGYSMANVKYHIKDLVVDDKFGTVLVGLCFLSFRIPVLEG